METSTLSMGLAMAAGLLTVLSPCILPILPILVGRSLQSHRYGPIALMGGLIAGFAVLGSLLGITASWFTGLASSLRTGAIAILFCLGVLSLVPQWSYRLFSYLPKWSGIRQTEGMGLMGEFWLGTQLGILWTPCAGPVLGSILVLAAVKHQVRDALGLLIAYGCGAALPLLVIAYGGRVLSLHLLNLRPYSAALQRAGGIAIIVTALAILWGWDVQIQLWLAPLFPPLSL